MAFGIDSLRLPGGPAQDELAPSSVDLGEPVKTVVVDPASGAQSIEVGDGSVIINLNPQKADEEDEDEFHANLADKISSSELALIAEELLVGIDADDKSREPWIQTRATGIDLLGLKLEKPRTGIGSAPLEGMSTVRHPLLLEATLRFQATARGELLPSQGPVKVRDDDDEGGDVDRDVLAQALEIDLNHYYTVTAPEYYPDTDRMLFYTGFGGLGIKKVYTCPIRRRPVSESVDANDLIVSDTVTDLRNAQRVTQRLTMRPSVLKRMQLVGAYRKVELHTAPPPQPNAVEQKTADVQGINQSARRPEDQPRVLYESYCELDLKDFPHKDDDGELTGLPLPYRVTIDKDSRQILAVHRNWDQDDEQCLAEQVYVKYPFVEGLGFYPIGLVHILGNATVALTAAWREMLDAGMFASFPGGLISKQVNRQESNEMRVPPGGLVPVDTGGAPIGDAVMPLPYRDVSQGLLGLTESITQIAQRVGGTADAAVGEGNQEAPVGTTLALIEQATKVMDAVHKRLHAAQAEEFQLMKREFKKDPASLWRNNKKAKLRAVLGVTSNEIDPAKLARFTAALNDADFVPAADPNTPSEMHRLMKAQALIQLMTMSQELPEGRLDPRRVIEYALRTIRINVDMFAPPPDPNAPPPVDPKVQAAQIQAQASEDRVKVAQIQSEDKIREIASKQRLADVDLQRDVISHHTATVQSQPEPPNLDQTFAEGGLVHMKNDHEQLMAAHDQTMAAHEADMAARQSDDAAREQDSQHALSQADIVQAIIANRAKELDIEKAKVAAKKPKPKPKGKK